MKKKFDFRLTIIFSLTICIIIFICIYFKPSGLFDAKPVYKMLSRMVSSQDIAPQRLYINTWRQAKNEYVDKNMNFQDWNRWRNRYLKHIKTLEDANVAINTMLASLNDSYTKFLITERYLEEKEIIDSKISGIGIIFNQANDGLKVDYILDDSPAQRNDIQLGDEIISINNHPASDISIDKVLISDEIRKSKYIKIVLKRDGKIIEKKIRKAEIPIKTMNYKITDDNIGIITLATIMGERAINDFINIILATNQTKGLIIDLRDNYGGILSNAIEMANYMLDDEQIVSIEGNDNKLEIYASNENLFDKKKIVVLVNKNTASAAEILAGTLKDNLGAIIIGENTYGKNAIQQVIPMSNNTGLIITSYKYILPNGEDINKRGIIPDINITDNKIMMKEAVKIINEVVKNID